MITERILLSFIFIVSMILLCVIYLDITVYIPAKEKWCADIGAKYERLSSRVEICEFPDGTLKRVYYKK